MRLAFLKKLFACSLGVLNHPVLLASLIMHFLTRLVLTQMGTDLHAHDKIRDQLKRSKALLHQSYSITPRELSIIIWLLCKTRMIVNAPCLSLKMNVGVMGIASPDGRRLERPSPSGQGLSLQAGAESLCLTGLT